MNRRMYPMEKPEFHNARVLAYELLLEQDNPCIGMKAEKVVVPNKKLVFSTLQEYSEITRVSMRDLTANGKISLGCHVNYNDEVFILLHNNEILYEPCENWTNIHEIGHICIGHTENGDKEEVEAHFFASCFLMPDPVLRILNDSGIEITKQLLTTYFGVSPDAAGKKLNTIRQGEFYSDLDEAIVYFLSRDIRRIINDVRGSNRSFINYVALDLI